MRLSEFQARAEEALGRTTARTLAAELVIDALGDRTADQALADGVPARDVWVALADAADVPEDRRWGRLGRRSP